MIDFKFAVATNETKKFQQFVGGLTLFINWKKGGNLLLRRTREERERMNQPGHICDDICVELFELDRHPISDLCEDNTTRAVIMTIQQQEARKKRLAFGVRDSRRQSRKYGIISCDIQGDMG